MSGTLLLGLDVGGGSCRAVLFDAEAGRVAGSASRTTPAAPATPDFGQDVDLRALVAAMAGAIGELLERARVPARSLAGLAGTSVRFASVFLDRAGEPIAAASNRDARGAPFALPWAAQHGEAVQAETGLWPASILAGPRLLWLAERDGGLEHVGHALALSDWLGFFFSGEIASEPSQASGTGLLDLATRTWSERWIEHLGAPARVFPRLGTAGEALGTLQPEAARALGLPEGLPVAIGGADTQSAALGVGAVHPGELVGVLGTTAPIVAVRDEPIGHPEGRVWVQPHLVPGRYLLDSNAGAFGDALEWMGALLAPEARNPARSLLARAAASAPGAGGLLSGFGAQVMNARSMEMPPGTLVLSPLLSGDPERRGDDLCRAVAEGLANAIAGNVAQLEASGLPTRAPLIATGGVAANPFFTQLLADVLDRPVPVSATPESTGLGAALCAGVAAGVFPDLETAASAVPPSSRVHRPDPGKGDATAALRAAHEAFARERAGLDALGGRHAIGALLASRAAGANRAAASPRPRILVTADLDDAAIAELDELGEVQFASYRRVGRFLKEDALVEALAGFDVFLTEIDLVDRDSLARLPELRVVGSCRGNAVNVDVAACSAYGIPVMHTPGRNADAVADLTLAFLLMLARKLGPATAFLREPGTESGDLARMGKAFGSFRGRELLGLTVGLVGFGAVGRKVARRLGGFGAELVVFDPYAPASTIERAEGAPVGLDELLERSDLVSLHAAVTPETEGLLGADAFARMRPGAGLVNTARAALLDENALAEALASGRLGGAALDVFAVEPPGADHPLLAHENVVATPHVGGNTVEVSAHQGRILIAELRRLLAGEPPHHVLNPETASGFDWEVPRRTPSAAELAALPEDGGPRIAS